MRSTPVTRSKALSAGREEASPAGNPCGVPGVLPAHAQCVNHVMEIFTRFGRGRLVLTRLDVAPLDDPTDPRYPIITFASI